MATVSSFESLRFPSRSDLAQFGELFEQLYAASSDEARRQAVAALSRCPQVPQETALFIARQPIGIAAIFLMGSKAITDGTLLDILHRGDANREGMGREAASSALDRYGLAAAAQQRFESLSGGQQARLQILLLELSGATLLLLDEPTDNLDLVSAEALEDALSRFDGTVLAVTHDRWFTRSFDRFVVFRSDGDVVESDAPVWNESRVVRAR